MAGCIENNEGETHHQANPEFLKDYIFLSQILAHTGWQNQVKRDPQPSSFLKLKFKNKLNPPNFGAVEPPPHGP